MGDLKINVRGDSDNRCEKFKNSLNDVEDILSMFIDVFTVF
jgi:hypothetical protein